MSEKIDKSIPRKMFDIETTEPPDVCPQCGAPLAQETGPYLVATRRGRRLTDEFVLSGSFGYLCPECPTAVIHLPELSDMLYGVPLKPGWEAGPEFAVIGLIDLDAVPPDKTDVPITNMIPQLLVPFEPDEGEIEAREPVDTGIERTLYFAGDDAPPENCMECGRPLVLDYGPYLVREVRQWQGDVDFVMAGPFAYLCPGCATAVIHLPALVDVMENTSEDFDGSVTLGVLGRFNLEAALPEQIPDSFEELPPELLVWYPNARRPYRRRKKRPRKPKPKRRKRRK
ncbi:MAG TPA: hypothetical protein EYP41_04675 [Anaerolineae bacterium]|nr:hypothetical protein [Anaerolineae bacterium]HIP70289.1 hypothetical protein [Anaerolineae bacterium]